MLRYIRLHIKGKRKKSIFQPTTLITPFYRTPSNSLSLTSWFACFNLSLQYELLAYVLQLRTTSFTQAFTDLRKIQLQPRAWMEHLVSKQIMNNDYYPNSSEAFISENPSWILRDSIPRINCFYVCERTQTLINISGCGFMSAVSCDACWRAATKA